MTRFDSEEGLTGGWAVLPSAFNPPTRAHLRLLELAGTVEGVRGQAALLTTRNVAKGIEGASLADRIGMLLAAGESRTGLAVLAANQARIVDQAAALRATWPEASFDFVLGHDTLVRLFEERFYADAGSMEAELDGFFALHRVIASNRGGMGVEEVRAWVAGTAGRYGERIVTVAIDDEHGGMASSHARARLGAGEAADDLPAEVVEYIREHGLYAGGGD